MMTQDALRFYKSHAVYDNFGGVVLDREEGKRIAKALGNGKAVILQNHGLLTVSETTSLIRHRSIIIAYILICRTNCLMTFFDILGRTICRRSGLLVHQSRQDLHGAAPSRCCVGWFWPQEDPDQRQRSGIFVRAGRDSGKGVVGVPTVL